MSILNQKIRTTIGRYLRETSGSTMMVFALSIPVVVGAMGMSVDMARAYLAKERLTHALDAAALAGAGSTHLTDLQLEQRVNAYFHKNFPDDGVGTVGALRIDNSNGRLKLSSSVVVDSSFMKVLGITNVIVVGGSGVQREIQGIDVALVLDVTGSMNTNNNIGSLRTAAKSFTDIMCPDEECHETVKIGLVPYATSVNVGPYGLGKNPDGSVYDTPFVNNPTNISFNQSQNNQWWGCILEKQTPLDTQNSAAGWTWNMYRYWVYDNHGNPAYNGPNQNCNKAYILPLTTKKTVIKSRITNLQAGGNTLGNIGMVWGYRLLSPEPPFREGAAFHDPEIRKVVVMMTDGDNFIGGSNSYSGYGHWSTHQLTNGNLNTRLSQTCENMKEDGIAVYTITFASGINNATRAIYRNCATDEDKYINAPTQQDLVTAFKKIAAELSNLYIDE